MKPQKPQREFFLDSIRAYLMLLGIPFHISLIYSSHIWAVNSAIPSHGLTIFNDVIHAFRMQVFLLFPVTSLICCMSATTRSSGSRCVWSGSPSAGGGLPAHHASATLFPDEVHQQILRLGCDGFLSEN